MAKKLCMEDLNGDCRNPAKGMVMPVVEGRPQYECPHCLREDGKDGNDNQLVDEEKAKKLFTILKDKVVD